MGEYKELKRLEFIRRNPHLYGISKPIKKIEEITEDPIEEIKGQSTPIDIPLKPCKKKARNARRAYYKEIRELTKLVDKKLIKGYNKGLIYNNKRDGLMVTAYNRLVIDHKIPLYYGYKNNIPAEYMADISNLQYLTVKENMIKGMTPQIDDQNRWIIDN